MAQLCAGFGRKRIHRMMEDGRMLAFIAKLILTLVFGKLINKLIP